MVFNGGQSLFEPFRVKSQGYESLWMNPLIGPSPVSLYACGGLFVDGGQHWRMISSLFLSIGAVQLIPGPTKQTLKGLGVHINSMKLKLL